MSYRAPILGIHVFKIILALTLPWALAMTLGLPFETFLEITLPATLGVSKTVVGYGIFALACGVVFAILWPGSRMGGIWLSLKNRIPLWKALVSTALWSLAGYVIAFPACLAAALFMTRGNTQGEPGIFVVIFALYMPMIWAIPIGAFLAWRRESQSQKNADGRSHFREPEPLPKPR